MAKNPAMQKTPEDRPFSPAVLRRAGEDATRYAYLVSHDGDRYLAKCIEIPAAFAFSDSEVGAIDAMRKRLRVLIAAMIESGRRLPTPMHGGKRDSQVNVRLTAEEKLQLSEASRREGFKGLSDFLRAAGLRAASN